MAWITGNGRSGNTGNTSLGTCREETSDWRAPFYQHSSFPQSMPSGADAAVTSQAAGGEAAAPAGSSVQIEGCPVNHGAPQFPMQLFRARGTAVLVLCILGKFRPALSRAAVCGQRRPPTHTHIHTRTQARARTRCTAPRWAECTMRDPVVPAWAVPCSTVGGPSPWPPQNKKAFSANHRT